MTQETGIQPYEENLKSVRRRMDEAARRAGRSPGEIALVAVSKFHPASAVRAVARCGQTAFGENYLQEAAAKMEALAGADALPLEWHFIGHLQSRKAQEAAGRFALIHTLDSPHLAQRLQRALDLRAGRGEAPLQQDVLIQVNIGREAQKSGVDEENLPPLARAIADLPGLRLKGLMCIPPLAGDAEGSRPWFRRLRRLRDSLAEKTGMALPHLSMGMSQDFEAAIEEGATIIRVGTDIFGPRPGARPDAQ